MLPLKHCGLAHCDESVAHRVGIACVEALNRDLREECHHRTTWTRMKPGVPLAEQSLAPFLDGAARSQLWVETRSAIAALKYYLVNEMYVEE